ncbi:MAG: hypothetical protein IJ612_07350 [Prevotella sp.]|nr:hypothetical protein [Prevotella sp.]
MRKKHRSNPEKSLALAPLNEDLSPQKRTQAAIALSEQVMRMVTYVICHAIVDFQEQLHEERLSVAHAFLQRVATTHLCNQKLTEEGIVYEYEGQAFQLHEEYKSMTLTRSVYEHLAMFYFLFERKMTDSERDVVWKYWQICSKKNFLDYGSDGVTVAADAGHDTLDEIERLRTEMMAAPMNRRCREKVDKWTRIGTPTYSGSIEFFDEGGSRDVRRVSYSQAWRYLFSDEAMTLFYRHLSMHCHPVYDGLLQYQEQTDADRGHDGIPLFFSTCFVAHLCRSFLKMLPGGEDLLSPAFSLRERRLFDTLSQLHRI